MKMLNIDVLCRAAGMNPMELAALLTRCTVLGADKPDVMLQGLSPAVGAVNVQPRYVSGVQVDPMYPGQRGRVGAPAQLQPANGQAPVNYSPEVYEMGDLTWMGLGSTTVAGLATVVIPVSGPRPFQPQLLHCPSTVQGLLLTAVSIGGTNIFCGQLGVPIELFSEVSTAPQIDWPTVQPAVGLDFTLFNPTAGPLPFMGALYGTQVRN